VDTDGPRAEHETAVPEHVRAIERRVQDRLGGRLRQFQVVPGARGLILRGRTSTYYAKQLAQQAVMEIAGVPIVANEIEVAIRNGRGQG